MSSDRESISAAYDALEAAFETVATLSYDALDVAESLGCFDRLDDVHRRTPAAEHQLLTHLQSRTTAAEVGAKNWADVLAIRLRISTKEAKRRVQEVQDLGPRTTLTGEPLAPRLAATASAQARGEINAEHVAIIRKCLNDAPVSVDATTRAQADQDLARIAAGNTPETLRQAADRLLFLLNQDGDAPNDEHRARRRGVILGRQDSDGMTPIRGWLDPELRASVGAVFAKFAAPGMCNPNDAVACVDGEPDPDAAQHDTRSVSQRNHDALKAMCRSVLASGELGRHKGLPVTVIVV